MNSPKESAKEKKPNPVLKANIFSKFLFLWTGDILKKGLKKDLKEGDLYKNLPFLNSNKLTKHFADHWKSELHNQKPSLLRLILRTYGPKVLPLCIIYSALEIFVHSVRPLLIGGLITHFVECETSTQNNEPYLYGAGLIISNFLLGLCYHSFNYFIFLKGMNVRMACAGLVYQKCLELPVNIDSCGMGAVAISALSKDLPQFDISFTQINNLWKGPIEIIVMSFIIWKWIGWQAIVGILVFIAFAPLQAWAAYASAVYRRKSAKCGDERLNFMSEIIAAIVVIKMYAWENFFAKKIAEIRKREAKFIKTTMKINACIQSSVVISKFALFVSLIAYIYTGELITAYRLFIATTFYSTLNESVLTEWTMAIKLWSETIACISRVNAFLLHKNESKMIGFDNFALEVNEKTEKKYTSRIFNTNVTEKSIKLKKVCGSWHNHSDITQKNILHIQNIDIEISKNEFVGIIGNVGSGKTTLLNAILGEIELTHGILEVNGIISYAPQDPWIFEGTIRDNIIFVEKFNENRYKNVLHVCELLRDIKLMPSGDSTIIGERGINLSGGQKARINLARAIYREADIYLFDDPLSAVDTFVGQRIMDECFLKFLNGKIRILVTHQMQYMKHVDNVILMEDGNIKKQGSYNELKEIIMNEIHTEHETIIADMTIKSEFRKRISTLNMIHEENLKAKNNFLERTEYQSDGAVKFQTYFDYFQALRRPVFVFCVLALIVLAKLCQGGLDTFLAKWSSMEDFIQRDNGISVDKTAKRQSYLILYSVLILSVLALFLLRSFSFYYMCYRISLRLHNMLFNGVIRAYMLFFDLNSSGRILNRFSNDIWRADVTLPLTLFESFWFFVDIVVVMLIVGWTNYWLLIPAGFIILLMYFLRKVYIRSARNLKRIESITWSPVFSHISQTFQGLTTIRALKANEHLEWEFHELQDTSASASFLLLGANRAFSLWVDITCCVYITLVICSFLFFGENFSGHQIGLAITQSIVLLEKCQQGLRKTADMENYMTSIERIMEYTRITSEPDLKTPENVDLSPNWPHVGGISFKNLYLRYSKTSPCVLRGLNFVIKPKEKIGIVGRTGAGKSSIIQAIFRLAINEGSIEIDGLDISKLGLHDLRSRISIIPQEPILFTGTLRYNLDPFAQKTDADMWRALEDVELKSYVMSLDGGLECPVYDGGVNFSTGQRQLVCLARAILRHNKILIMDEATANVDPYTDKLIQETIHTNFRHCTVLTIAHRLHTVMDSDRVMVISNGQIAEFDHPYKLLQKQDGHLYKMVKETGKSVGDHLAFLAKENFDKYSINQ